MQTHISTGGKGSALQSPKSTPVDRDDRVDAMSYAFFLPLDDFSRYEKNVVAGSIREREALEDSIKRWEKIAEDPIYFDNSKCSLCLEANTIEGCCFRPEIYLDVNCSELGIIFVTYNE